MNVNAFIPVLGQAAAPASQAPALFNFVPIILLFVAMYFVMIRPQQKRTKELNNQLKTLKPGDKVVTGSGIVGTVVSVKDRTISLRSAETKLEVLKSAVSEITERAGGPETSEA